MPPKPKKTREEVIEAALTLVKNEGMEALTARRLAQELGVSAPAIFTHFASMEELNEAVMQEVKKEYNKYAENGLSMNLPFKGYAMEIIRFASECPAYFELLFMKRRNTTSLSEFIGFAGNEEVVIKAVTDTFGIDEGKAERLYHLLWTYVHGISCMIVCGACKFTKEEIGSMVGEACRGAVIAINLQEDDRINLMPEKDGEKIDGMDSYFKIK